MNFNETPFFEGNPLNYTIQEASQITGVKEDTIRNRLERGIEGELLFRVVMPISYCSLNVSTVTKERMSKLKRNGETVDALINRALDEIEKRRNAIDETP